MVGFTSRQIERSKLSRKIYINVGLPTVNNFKHMVSTNIISNCSISVADIRNAENMYGLSMTSLKVKSTRIKPRPVIKYYIQIPSDIKKKFKHWVMHWRFLYKWSFFSGIYWRTIEIHISYSHHISEWRRIFKHLGKILHKYNLAGFNITTVHADN